MRSHPGDGLYCNEVDCTMAGHTVKVVQPGLVFAPMNPSMMIPEQLMKPPSETVIHFNLSVEDEADEPQASAVQSMPPLEATTEEFRQDAAAYLDQAAFNGRSTIVQSSTAHYSGTHIAHETLCVAVLLPWSEYTRLRSTEERLRQIARDATQL